MLLFWLLYVTYLLQPRHSSKHACWKCSKPFPYNSDLNRVDFSGEDIGTLWTHEQHKRNALRALSAVTPSQRNEIETETGSRFTELMNLPYYDCIRYALTCYSVHQNICLQSSGLIVSFLTKQHLKKFRIL